MPAGARAAKFPVMPNPESQRQGILRSQVGGPRGRPSDKRLEAMHLQVEPKCKVANPPN